MQSLIGIKGDELKAQKQFNNGIYTHYSLFSLDMTRKNIYLGHLLIDAKWMEKFLVVKKIKKF